MASFRSSLGFPFWCRYLFDAFSWVCRPLSTRKMDDVYLKNGVRVLTARFPLQESVYIMCVLGKVDKWELKWGRISYFYSVHLLCSSSLLLSEIWAGHEKEEHLPPSAYNVGRCVVLLLADQFWTCLVFHLPRRNKNATTTLECWSGR